MSNVYDELDFPKRAELVTWYDNYQVDIAHWKNLSTQFSRQFRGVFVRRDAAVLLVYGPTGSGKSLFCRRLLEDYQRSAGEDASAPDVQDNLWHALIAADKLQDEDQVREVTEQARVERVDEGELSEIRKRLKEVRKKEALDKTAKRSDKVTLYLLDDAQMDGMVQPWTEMSLGEFYMAKQQGPDAILDHVAERINHACRHELQSSIFVMLSNDKKWLEDLKGYLDKWFKGLANLVDLPAPPPNAVERIVRVNTNPPFSSDDVQKLTDEFMRMGQSRSRVYEAALRLRVAGQYGRGFGVYRSLQPDVIVKELAKKGDKDVEYGEYKICQITQGVPKTENDDDVNDAIAEAILRTGHAVEFTAFMGDKLANLEEYLIGKIDSYAVMLEAV